MKLEWTNDMRGFDYSQAKMDESSMKAQGWRLPSPQELMDAAKEKVPGFENNRYYWSNDWNGDPTHAGAVELYSGIYMLGMQLNMKLNYRLVKEI